jgi:putative colanic acid biosynthesis UDP-glucose lipid carrier transferase
MLSSSTLHTIRRDQLPASWLPINKIGIVRSFVASRKKYLLLKRAFDLLFSFAMIVAIMSWLTPLLALIIKLDSRGPVFFRQHRIGRNGKPFSCLKFRTMVPNDLADEQPAVESDERITRIGRILRRINVDEFPQFFNIFIGQMSVVGPRPHMVSDCIRFSFVIPSYQFRSLLRPGLTGWAQVNGYHGQVQDYESIIIRYYWDAQYIRKAGFMLDMKILWSTIFKGLSNIKAILFLPRRKETSVSQKA